MTRWESTAAPRGAAYDRRWELLAAAGESIHGEADLVGALLAATGGTTVLDAGCGTGRVALELARRGIPVIGIDADHAMLSTARAKNSEISWIQGDLAGLEQYVTDSFDLVVLAGNVMIFLSPGTEAQVLAQCARRLRPGGLLVAGFSLRPDRLSLSDYDIHARSASLELVDRWATWDRTPYTGGDYAVTVHQRPGVDRQPIGSSSGTPAQM